MTKRVYYVSGNCRGKRIIFDNLDDAIKECDKRNKKAKKYKRMVFSGIPTDLGYENVEVEYQP